MIKTAVVGVGYFGAYHAEKYHKCKSAQLCAVVDVDIKRAGQIANKYRAQPLSDYQKLPELGVQCASIASTTSSHFEIAAWLLRHGIDVLVEKPVTTSVAEAEDLIKIAKQEKRLLQVGHLERFNPAFRKLQDILTQPWFFEVRRITPYTGRGQDVDVILDLMIHDIDIVSYLVRSPLQKVEAVGIPVVSRSIDIANARLTFANGAVANVTASRTALQSERTIRIFQPDLYISLNFEKRRLKVCRKAVSRFGLPKVTSEETKITERDALQDQIDSFVNCVAERRTPLVTGEDGLRALIFADQIRKALKDGMNRIPGALISQVVNF